LKSNLVRTEAFVNLHFAILYHLVTYYKHLIVPPTPLPGLCVQLQSISMVFPLQKIKQFK